MFAEPMNLRPNQRESPAVSKMMRAPLGPYLVWLFFTAIWLISVALAAQDSMRTALSAAIPFAIAFCLVGGSTLASLAKGLHRFARTPWGHARPKKVVVLGSTLSRGTRAKENGRQTCRPALTNYFLMQVLEPGSHRMS